MESFCNLITIRLEKFEEDSLKTVGGGRFPIKLSIFASLTCPFNKEPIELYNLITYISKFTEGFNKRLKQLLT